MCHTLLKILLLSGLLMISAAGQETCELSGIVRDMNGTPLPGVSISRVEGGELCRTGTDGVFRFSCPAGPLHVLFSHPAYLAETRTIETGEREISLDVWLVKKDLLKDEVTVTATSREELAIHAPFAQNVVTGLELAQNLPENMVAAVSRQPGVSFIGRGGSTVTPSIRGLARRRVLVLADGCRIVSDRAAGTSASFIAPGMVDRAEVLRSSAAVLYGSDAIGGVMQIFSKEPPAGRPFWGAAELSGSSASRYWSGGMALGGSSGQASYYGRFNVRRADDYHSARGEVHDSGYTYFTGLMGVDFGTTGRQAGFSLLKSYGQQIERPDRVRNPDSRTVYPLEDNNLLRFHYQDRQLFPSSEFKFTAFANPNRYDLVKTKFSSRTIDSSWSRSVDFGAAGRFETKAGTDWIFQYGLDFFGRRNVDMFNGTCKAGKVTSFTAPMENGSRSDTGLFMMADYTGLETVDLIAGFRYSLFSSHAMSDGRYLSKDFHAPAAFGGIAKQLGSHSSVFFNAGTAYRVPSLSESFYTGLSGRAYVIGNPDLRPERSINLDGGVKFYNSRYFLGVYLFQYNIRHQIERYLLPDKNYTYGNIEQGRIRGAELEGQVFPLEHLEFFGNLAVMNGENPANGVPLNDVPSTRAQLGVKAWYKKFWGELAWTWQDGKENPGPAEIPMDAWHTADLKMGYMFSSRFSIYFRIENLLNRYYFANPDPDIPPAKGIDAAAGLSFEF